MHSVTRERPLDPLTLEVLRQVDRVARELSVDYFVVGAMARDLLLHAVFGLESGRATRDVDLAVVVAGWPHFEAIKARLVGTGAFIPDERAPHRLHHRSSFGEGGYPLDLIPFGGVEQPGNQIAWPPDGSVLMNVLGYDEAFATADHVEVEPGFVVRAASLVGLAVLKLVAWAERGTGDPRDAIDLATLLHTYCDAGNADRLYETEIGVLETANYDLELAGARLLGMDAGRIVTIQTRTHILAVLDDPVRMHRLVLDMARGLRSAEDPIVAAEKLLAHFKAGFAAS